MKIFDTINWGIIGCGNVTEVKSGPPLQLTPHSHLVAVMRRNGVLAADYAKRHQVPRWYDNADLLINDPEVNAVYVATPPDTHLDYAIKAMRAGKPVYIEKPMARNHEECLKILQVSQETGIPIFVAYYRRALPGFVKVKELVEAEAIGSIRMINVRFYQSNNQERSGKDLPWRLVPEIAGGGLLFDLASHTLDYLDYIFGAIGEIKANAFNQGGKYAAEDLVLANWQHESGVAGTGAWCFTTSDKSTLDEVEIIGDQGVIRFSTFEFSPVIMENRDGRVEFPFPRPPHVQSDLMRDIVAALRGQGNSPSTGKTAARTNWVLDRMVENYYHIGKKL